MKQKILTTLLALVAIALNASAANVEPYAVLSNNGMTLTFYFDNKKDTREGSTYGVGGNVGWTNDCKYTKEVVFDGSFADYHPTTCSSWFKDMRELTNITNIQNLKTDYVTDMSSMFYDCSSLTSLNLSGFNTAHVTNMGSMFEGCYSLPSLDVSNFNTSRVIDMSWMFYDCSSLTSLDLSNFTFNSGTSTSYMLFKCTGLNRLVIPATANELSYNAFDGVGTQSAPCLLYHPEGLTLNDCEEHAGYFKWKGGYFRDAEARPYAVLSNDNKTLTFYNDDYNFLNSGTAYCLNTGSNSPGWKDYREYVTSVVFHSSFANARPTSCKAWFYGMNHLTSITGIENLKTDEVTDMNDMFDGCSSLTSLDVSGFTTRKVTNMSWMFSGCSSLTSLDVSGFTTANVTNMGSMFRGCSNLTSLNVSGFDTWRVTDMGSMFRYCSSLTSLDLSDFTFNSGINTYAMLSSCTGLNRLVIPDTANELNDNACYYVGTSTPCTLYYPEGFTLEGAIRYDSYFEWKEGDFKDADPEPYAVLSTDSKTLTFYYDRYRFTRNGTDYDLNTGSNAPGWCDYTASVEAVVFNSSFAVVRPTSCCSWFKGMNHLTSISGIENLKTDEVTDMSSMFHGCSSLASLDVSGFTTANVTDMSSMFSGCSSLTSLNVSGFTTSNVTNMNSMFHGCSSLESLNVSGFSTSNVTNMGSMFEGCSHLTSLNVSGFSTSNVTNMGSMFYGCSSLSSLNVSGFSTANVINMSSMFRGCSNLTSLSVYGFNTANVLNTSEMFRGCSGLTSLNVSGFITSKVLNMSEMFRGCTGLTSLNVSNFSFYQNTSKIFYQCSGLKNLTIPSLSSNYLASDACTGVGTTSNPCRLYFTEDLTLQGATQGNGYITWKSGTFRTAEKYASLSSDKKTLTFYYGFGRAQYATTYDLNTGSNSPGWYTHRTSVTSVVFDPSFADARPTSCYRWFYGMSHLTSITGMNNYLTTYKVTNMSSMFEGCSSLTSLDLSGFTLINSSSSMLSGCSGLQTLTLPATANKLASDACRSVGTTTNPCVLVYPDDVTLQGAAQGNNGYYIWRLGVFRAEAYAALSNNDKTLTFYCDGQRASRTDATTFDLNTGYGVVGWSDNATTITKVVFAPSFAIARPTSCYRWFYGMRNLTSITGIENLKTDEVTNMDQMFQSCSSLKSLDLSGFSISTTSSSMLAGCSSLLALTLPATANNLPNTACQGVGTTTKPCTLYYPEDLTLAGTTQYSNYFRWKTGYFKKAVVEPYAVLSGSTSLTFYYDKDRALRESQVGLTVYDLNTGATIPDWYQKTSITTVVFDPSFADARPTSCYRWFYSKINLTTITGIEYLNTTNVTNMKEMFRGCSRLTSLDVSGFITSGVTDMNSMFYGCSRLTSLDVSGFGFPASAYTSNMIANCRGLRTLVVGTAANVLNNNACNGVGTAENPCTLIYPDNIELDGVEPGDGYFTWKSGTFKELCLAYAVVSPDLTTLTFYYDSNKKSRSGTAYGLNTGDNSPGWRGGYQTITNVVFDPSFADARPESCYGWFDGMPNLATITGIEHLNTEEVTNMYFMFAWCESLTSVDLSRFDTSKVTDMSGMFKGCSQLTNIFSNDSWQRDGLTSTEMFTGCSSLVGAVPYDEAATDASMANPTDGYFTATSGLPGDVNNDNVVDIADVKALANYLVGQTPAIFIYAAADMNHDGEVSIADAVLIVNEIVE